MVQGNSEATGHLGRMLRAALQSIESRSPAQSLGPVIQSTPSAVNLPVRDREQQRSPDPPPGPSPAPSPPTAPSPQPAPSSPSPLPSPSPPPVSVCPVDEQLEEHAADMEVDSDSQEDQAMMVEEDGPDASSHIVAGADKPFATHFFNEVCQDRKMKDSVCFDSKKKGESEKKKEKQVLHLTKKRGREKEKKKKEADCNLLPFRRSRGSASFFPARELKVLKTSPTNLSHMQSSPQESPLTTREYIPVLVRHRLTIFSFASPIGPPRT